MAHPLVAASGGGAAAAAVAILGVAQQAAAPPVSSARLQPPTPQSVPTSPAGLGSGVSTPTAVPAGNVEVPAAVAGSAYDLSISSDEEGSSREFGAAGAGEFAGMGADGYGSLVEAAPLGRAAKRARLSVGDLVCTVCERSFPFQACVNTGTEAYPAWRCKPCHNACRALDRAAESRGKAAQAALSQFKRQRAKAWRQDVLKFRINSADDPPLPEHLQGSLGVDSLGSRKHLLQAYLESLGGMEPEMEFGRCSRRLIPE